MKNYGKFLFSLRSVILTEFDKLAGWLAGGRADG